MQEIVGTSNRVLVVDLSSRSATELEIPETDRRLYLGGKGLGLKLLYDRMAPGVDPLGPDNLLAVMPGVLLGTGAPCSGRFAAVTKSPLTGLMAASSCGGPFGMGLKTAGYDGLLISGSADEPVALHIDHEGVRFESAAQWWGQDTVETQAAMALGRREGALVIGPAGENRVRFANIASGHRFFGRGGFGAVMGAKNLKAVIAHGGRYRIVPRNGKAFEKVKKRAATYIERNTFTAKVYRQFGTAANVNYCQRGGILPVNNFRHGAHERAGDISGEAYRERYKTRPHTCKPCSILCGHKGTASDDARQVPEYETIGMLGANLGIFDADAIARFNDICSRMGMDTISAGATLAFVMEAGEKDLLTTDLAFGAVEPVAGALEAIALRKGFGDEMANGSRWLSQRYGGGEFAMHVKGLEIAAYDPRGSWGQGLAYAVANRGGCHLSATLMVMEVFLGLLNPFRTGAKARFVCFLENLYAAINSLHTCLFTSFAYMLEPPASKYTPRFLLGLTMQYLPVVALRLMDVRVYSGLYSAVTGTRLTQGQMLEAGERIHILERWMNTREGVRRKDDTLPARLLTEGRTCDPKGRTVPLEQMLAVYYRLRGYDADGIPSTLRLKALQIPVRYDQTDVDPDPCLREVLPGRSIVKRLYLVVVLWFMGRAVRAAARSDAGVGREFEDLPEGFTFALGVAPEGPWMVVGKDDRGRVCYLGSDAERQPLHLRLSVKNMAAAFRMFSFQESTATAVSRNRLTVFGETPHASAVVRVLDAVQVFLLPKPVARLAVKRYPQWPLKRKLAGRLMIYLRTLTGI